MPTYDYRCSACHHQFERWQGIADGKLRTCPRCKKPKLVRLVGSGAGLIFKGSGFYETDYKRSRTPAPASDGKTETTSDSKGDSKGDSKSDSKGDTTPSKPVETPKPASPKKTSKKGG